MAKYPIASLKCIDLSNPDINQSAELIKQACVESGIFYVINHGINKELVDEVFLQNKKLFGLPQNEKMKLLGNQIDKPRGYEAPRQKDYVERFTLALNEDDPTNVWPASDILPGWKETTKRYCQETFDVGMTVMRIMALSLGVNTDFFDRSDLLGGTTTSLYIALHYGEHESDSTKAKLGLFAHNDGTFITLLSTDDISGLQICKNKDAKPQVWEDVLPMKGAFIVVVGEIMKRLTNDVYRAVHHRTAYRKERYSSGVFFTPSFDWVMECLPSCQSNENPPKYPRMKYLHFVHSNLDLENLDDTNNKINDGEA